jgi:hypothetical protein
LIFVNAAAFFTARTGALPMAMAAPTLLAVS